MSVRGSSTGIKGVHFKQGKFRAVGYVDRTPVYLGTFERMDEAKAAYDKWKETPTVRDFVEARPTLQHKEERSSPEMYALVDAVFLRLFEGMGK